MSDGDDGFAVQVVRMGPGDPHVDEVPRLEQAVEVHHLVRPGPALDPALPTLAFHEHLNGFPHERPVALDGDALLEGHESIEPLLDDILRDLIRIGARGRSGAG